MEKHADFYKGQGIPLVSTTVVWIILQPLKVPCDRKPHLEIQTEPKGSDVDNKLLDTGRKYDVILSSNNDVCHPGSTFLRFTRGPENLEIVEDTAGNNFSTRARFIVTCEHKQFEVCGYYGNYDDAGYLSICRSYSCNSIRVITKFIFIFVSVSIVSLILLILATLCCLYSMRKRRKQSTDEYSRSSKSQESSESSESRPLKPSSPALSSSDIGHSRAYQLYDED
ncbi:hypothetical protein ACOME3_004262 [Neoechinorhynchus agilis]